jgi:hypothetical protein
VAGKSRTLDNRSPGQITPGQIGSPDLRIPGAREDRSSGVVWYLTSIICVRMYGMYVIVVLCTRQMRVYMHGCMHVFLVLFVY